jgi:hypothetical protein
LITRPVDLSIIRANFEFNFQNILELEIDLTHINKLGRSQFTEIDVLNIVSELIGNKILSPSSYKEFGDEHCTYYVKTSFLFEKKYKVVFCICSDKPNTIGVITLHRI